MSSDASGQASVATERVARSPQFVASAWGLHPGKHSLRALRVGLDRETEILHALAVDTIPYPPNNVDITSGLNAVLPILLDRHGPIEDPVALIAPPGSGITDLFPVPRVPEERLADLVRFELPHRVPLRADEIISSYQVVPHKALGPYKLDPEMELLLLAAIRRDRLSEWLAPFQEYGVQVDLVQLRQLALLNYVHAQALVGPFSDPDSPVVIIDVGLRETHLTLVHQWKIKTRMIMTGGERFTYELAEGLKITPAHAEAMKRTLGRSGMLKDSMDAMKPAIRDFGRDVGRELKVLTGGAPRPIVVALGGTFQLPNVIKYLRAVWGASVVRPTAFFGLNCNAVGGTERVGHPFVNAYALALQVMNLSLVNTNLIPPELVSRPKNKGFFSWMRRGSGS